MKVAELRLWHWWKMIWNIKAALVVVEMEAVLLVLERKVAELHKWY